LRRGDYLKFASHIVDDDTVIRLLKKNYSLLSQHLIIISDDAISNNIKAAIQSVFTGKPPIYIEGGDIFISHAIMRFADVLIASNSFFSLSAALLQKQGGIAIIPQRFFGDQLPSHNKAISTLSEWTLLRY
jgi:hypothetical protein